MKSRLLILILANLLLAACSTTQNNEQTSAIASTPNLIELPQDTHSQAIIDILKTMSIPQIARVAMNNKLAEDKGTTLPPAYVKCINAQLTDNQIFALMLPVYKNNLDESKAIKLASFYKSPTGQKLATVLKIKLGEPLTMPKITSEDVKVMAEYKPILEELRTPALREEAKMAGYNLGIQLGLQCASEGAF